MNRSTYQTSSLRIVHNSINLSNHYYLLTIVIVTFVLILNIPYKTSYDYVLIKNDEYKLIVDDNYFPKKVYKGVEYKEGLYESLVVTLGKGEGNNWWCVLFPPICMIEAEESSDIEYTTMVKEVINKYF